MKNNSAMLATILLLCLSLTAPLKATTYFQAYEQCLLDGCPDGVDARCRSLVTTLSQGYSRLSSSVAALAPSIPCQTGDDIYFGNGIRVDATTCGARPASDECQSIAEIGNNKVEKPILTNSCQGLDGRTIASDSAGPLHHWETILEISSAGSRSYGQEACGQRVSVAQRAAELYQEGVSKLLKCFSPTGDYPHTRLYAALIEKLTSLQASGGLRLTCPDDDIERRRRTGTHPAATTHASTNTINVFQSTFAYNGTNTMGHEFMHLFQNDTHPIDNMDTLSHNHPHDHHSHVAQEGSDEYHPSAANPNGASNQMMDRVYSCTGLCFKNNDEVMSKEECRLCLGYRTPTLPTSLARKCDSLMTRAAKVELENQLTISDRDIRDMCNTQYERMSKDYHDGIKARAVSGQGYSNELSFGNDSQRDEFGIYMVARQNGGFMSRWGDEPSSLKASPLEIGRMHPREILEQQIRSEVPSKAFSDEISLPRISLRSNPAFGEVLSRCASAYNDGLSKVQELMTQFPNDKRNQEYLLTKQVELAFGAKSFSMKRICNKIKVYGLWQDKCQDMITIARCGDLNRACSSSTYNPEMLTAANGLCNKLRYNNRTGGGDMYRSSMRPLLQQLSGQATSWNCQSNHMRGNSTYTNINVPEALTFPGSDAVACDEDTSSADVEESSEPIFTQAQARTFCEAQDFNQ